MVESVNHCGPQRSRLAIVGDVADDGAVKKKKGETGKKAASRELRERAAWTAMYRFVVGRTDHYADAADAIGLTMPQTTVLRALEPEAPVPMVSLATTLSCHPSNITGLIDRLEEQGLVARHACTEDRRVKNVVLTEKGDDARKRLCSLLFSPPAALRRLDDDEIDALVSLLEKLFD
jgi:DNA-binding MarR family transcriptional regulator